MARTSSTYQVSYPLQSIMDSDLHFAGVPARWSPPRLPTYLVQRQGPYWADYNAYRVPECPFEPAFRALQTMNPNYKLDNVDVLINRNSLMRLLEFASGGSTDSCCLEVFIVKDTLVVHRADPNAPDWGQPRNFGHAFEEMFTEPEEGLEDAVTHHRVIAYDLGPLRVAVRLEADAYYAEGVENELLPLDQLSYSSPSVPPTLITASFPGGTRVALEGDKIPFCQVAELKTGKGARSAKKTMAQLWFGRTQYLCATRPQGDGRVDAVTCEDKSEEILEWEESHQEGLRKLVGLLEELKYWMKHGGERCVGIDVKTGHLDIYQVQGQRDALPMDIMARHWTT